MTSLPESSADQQLENSLPVEPRSAAIVSYSLLAFALFFAIFVRSRLANMPLERDEGEYAYAGQLILSGIPPYKFAYNMKLPGTYLAYAAILAVFGETAAGVHYGLLVVNVLSILLLFWLTRSLLDSIAAGAATIAYAIITVSPSVLGMAAHATHFVALFALAGACALWKYVRTDHPAWSWASGLCFGIGFLMKQHGIFLIPFGFFYLLWLRFGPGRDKQRRLLFALPLYLLGSGLPYLLCAGWLWHAGVWEKFTYWTIDYAAHYVRRVDYDTALYMFWQACVGVIGRNWPIWLLAFVGLIELLGGGGGAPRARSFAVFFFLSLSACVFPGLLFRQHYFIPVLPAVAICAGNAASAFWRMNSGVWLCDRFLRWSRAAEVSLDSGPAVNPVSRKQALQRPVLPRPVAVVGLTACFSLTIWLQSASFFFWSPELTCHRIYLGNPFVESPIVARYLEQHTTPDQTIAVLGSEPQLFFYAKRRSSTGYIYMYPMMERQPLARQMQSEMIREIEQAQPSYVVLVNIRISWLPQNDETVIFDWCDDYLRTNYEQVGIVDMPLFQKSVFRWDEQAVNARPNTPNNMMIFRRKMNPND